MQLENLIVGQSVAITSLTPVDSGGKPTTGVVQSATYSIADTTIATVTADTTSPITAVVAAIAAGSTVLTVAAVVTDADGTTVTVPGSATIVVNAKPNPTVAVTINFGTPA